MNDRAFLQWLYDRLHHYYGEDKRTDFMYRLAAIIEATPAQQHTPNAQLCPTAPKS